MILVSFIFELLSLQIQDMSLALTWVSRGVVKECCVIKRKWKLSLLASWHDFHAVTARVNVWDENSKWHKINLEKDSFFIFMSRVKSKWFSYTRWANERPSRSRGNRWWSENVSESFSSRWRRQCCALVIYVENVSERKFNVRNNGIHTDSYETCWFKMQIFMADATVRFLLLTSTS